MRGGSLMRSASNASARQVDGRAGCIRHRDALHRDQRRERQQHRPAGGPAFEHHAPLLLDQDPPRGRLDGQAGGPDEARDQLVLRAVVLVDAKIGLHLGERYGLDGGAFDEYGNHLEQESFEVMKRLVTLCLALAYAFALGAPGAQAIVGGAEDDGPLARASVMVLSSNGGVCSAVVLAQDVVLTAAHCVTGAAEHRVHFRDEAGQPVLIVPAAKAVHPGYDAKAIETRQRSIDLALVRIPEPLPARFERATLTRREGRREHARRRRRLRAVPRGRREDLRHLPHGIPDRGRALRPEPHPALGARDPAGERLPGRFRRADGLRSGGRGDHELVVAGQGPQLRRRDAGHPGRPAARLDRPHPERLEPRGLVGGN